MGSPLHVKDAKRDESRDVPPDRIGGRPKVIRDGLGNQQAQHAAKQDAVSVDSFLNPPADQVVGGLTYRPVWQSDTQTWDFVDPFGKSLYSTVVQAGGEPQVCKAEADPKAAEAAFRANIAFWAGLQAAWQTQQAKKLVDEAVGRLVVEQGPRLDELDKMITYYRRDFHGGQQEWDFVLKLTAQRQAIIDAYDPSVPTSTPATVASGLVVLLPYSTAMHDVQGPAVYDVIEKSAHGQNAQMSGGSKGEGAVRTSVGDAYAYDIETNGYQVGNDLDRLARAGYTEIHIATGTHGDAVGGLTPEMDFFVQDAQSIQATMQAHPGLKIVPYVMSHPGDAAKFAQLQALAAEGKLPGGATVAAFCFSQTRTPGLNDAPSAAFTTRESLNAPQSMTKTMLHGGLAAGVGLLDVYDGLHDPDKTTGTIRVVGGGLQVVGGASYVLGYAWDSVGLVRWGSRASTVGGSITAPLVFYDVFKDMQSKLDPNSPQPSNADALYSSSNNVLKLASLMFPEAIAGAVVLNYGVKPMAEKASEIAAPAFLGAMSQAYGISTDILSRW